VLLLLVVLVVVVVGVLLLLLVVGLATVCACEDAHNRSQDKFGVSTIEGVS
jgi:hypothetical protein